MFELNRFSSASASEGVGPLRRNAGLTPVKAGEFSPLYRARMTKSFLVIVAALAPVSARAAEAPGAPYAWGPGMMWAWSGMIFGPLFMVLLLAVVIGVAVLLVRWIAGPWQGTAPPHHPPPARTPLDILKERFARGEIDKEEFEERRRVLGE